jgi:hypothetical protein
METTADEVVDVATSGLALMDRDDVPTAVL